MKHTRMAGAGLSILAASLAAPVVQADVTRQDVIMAQTAGALASGEYAERHCPGWRLDHAAVERNLRRAGKVLADLHAHESYAEQRDALLSVERQHGRAMVCLVLPAAVRAGYRREIVVRR